MCDKYFKSIANSLRNRDIYKHKTADCLTNAAVVMILKKSANYSEALFIKRSINDQDVFSGHMAFPGGKKNVDDKTLLDTAIRETYEEVGINLQNKSIILGELDDCKPNNPKARGVVVTPYVSCLADKSVIKIDHKEVSDYIWIPILDLYKQYRTNLSSYGFEFNKKRYEYRYEDYFIWGLTGRIITQFMELTSDLYEY
jgi:8-oxo-dGTP pyrophosphatase MutT (NUDIX family)